jgi:hypothetical protein
MLVIFNKFLILLSYFCIINIMYFTHFSHVIVLGDINTTHKDIDHCEATDEVTLFCVSICVCVCLLMKAQLIPLIRSWYSHLLCIQIKMSIFM